MATLSGNDVMDGGVKIGVIEHVTYSGGGYMRFRPAGDSSWSKGMGQTIDHEWLGTLFACSICNGCASVDFFKDVRDRLLTKRICFGCDNWQQLIVADALPENTQRTVIVDGEHYRIHPDRNLNDPVARDCSGYGGARWDIEFLDGRKVTTHNLWCQGKIPQRWRGQLPDNARFAKRTIGAPA